MSQRISVVIPMFNRRGLIRRAVDSVLSQSLADFELIVVDDGSTDGGAEVVREIRDRRLRLVCQPNQGECAARNRGLAEASGDWVGLLDSDDEWRPGFLEATARLAAANPSLVAVFTNLRSVSPDARWLDIPFRQPRVIDDYFAFCVRNDGRGMTCSSALVARKAVLEAGGFPVGVNRSGDVDTWMRLAMAGPIGCVPEELALFHNETAGSRTLFPRPDFPEQIKTLRRLRGQRAIPPARLPAALRLENHYLLTYTRDLITAGDFPEARRVLWRECSWRHCSWRRLARVCARLILKPAPGLALALACLAAPARAGVLEATQPLRQQAVPQRDIDSSFFNMKLGRTTLHPYYQIAELYDSNIYLAPSSHVPSENADANQAGPIIGSAITQHEVGLKSATPAGDRQELDLAYDATWLFYSKDPAINDTVNEAANALYRYEGPFLSAEVADDYLNTSDPASTELTAREKRWENTLKAQAEYAPPGRSFFAGIDGRQATYKYVAGDPDLRAELDRYEQEIGLRAGYKLAPKTRLYAAYHRQVIHYTVFQDVSKDSKSHLFDAGLEGEISPKLTGQIQTGLQARHYSAPTPTFPKDTLDWMVATNLDYKPLERTDVLLGLSRDIIEAAEASEFYIANVASLSVEHRLPPKLSFGVIGSIEIDEFGLTTVTDQAGNQFSGYRRDDVYTAGVRGAYNLQPWLRLTLGTAYRARFSPNFSEQVSYRDQVSSAELAILL